jgi:hypothetical protein
MKKLLTFLFLAVILSNTFAQTSDQNWGLGLYIGETEYNGDLGNDFFKCNSIYTMGGLSISRYLNPFVDVAIQGDFGYYGSDHQSGYFLAKKIDADLLLKYKFNNGIDLKEDALFAPFVAFGVGLANYSDAKTNAEGLDALIPVGAGIKLRVSRNDLIDLQYQFLYNVNLTNKGDIENAGSKLSFITHSLGIIFNFGAPKDSDKD